MHSKTKIVLLWSLAGVTLFTVLFLSAREARAASSFFVDSSYDVLGRAQVTATPRFEGNHAHYFVEDAYWDGLGASLQNKLINDISQLSQAFDQDIYNKVTLIFGQEWKPGIDNDVKLTILLTHLQEDAGGYFQSKDEYPRATAENSNEKEMFYLNVRHVGFPRAKAFLAHEFQHLINFNQKTRLKGINEEIWLNELLSEITPTLVGLDNVYAGSNLQERVKSVAKNPGDALLDWENKSKDYGSVNLFAQYLLDRFGKDLFTFISQDSATGIQAVNDALLSLGRSERFENIFRDWVVTLLINDCNLVEVDRYCYKNPNLSKANLSLSFSSSAVGSLQQISFGELTKDWAGNWFSWQALNLQPQRPAEHVFHLAFSADVPSDFFVSYIVIRTDGAKNIYTVPILNGQGELDVEDFGYLVKEVVLMPINEFRSQGTIGNILGTRFFMNVKLQSNASAVAMLADNNAPAFVDIAGAALVDGDLIKTAASYDIFIVKLIGAKKFKRLILNPDIFNSYGHLKWSNVKSVSQTVMDAFTLADLVIEVNADGSVYDPKVYKISSSPNSDVGQRQWLNMTAAQFELEGYVWDAIYHINHTEAGVNFYPLGIAITS